MTDSRYVPRSFFRNDLDFGDPEATLQWKARADWAPGSNEDQARASWFQHQVAQSMRSQISARYPSLRGFADSIGVKTARLGRVLRGDYVMQLEDLGLAERVLGVSLRLIEAPPSQEGG